MTRQFALFATQLALITASVTAILYVLKVPDFYLKLAIAIGVGILALSALFVAVSNLGRVNREAKPDDGARERKAQRRARARLLLRRLDAFFAELRAPAWRYREPAAAPWWLVVGPAGQGKSTLLRAAPGARERAPLGPDVATHEPRFFSAEGLAFVELPDDFAEHPGYAAFLRRLHRRRPAQPFAGVLVVTQLGGLTPPSELLAGTRALILRLCDDLSLRIPLVLALPGLDQIAGFPDFCEGLAPYARPLGVTLGACDSSTAVAQGLRARLAEPLTWVRQRCHALIARPRTSAEQAHLYGFWQHFTELAERTVAAAVYLAAQPLSGGESLRPRGAYFLAAGDGASSAVWLDRLAHRLGGALPAAPPAASAPNQAFVRALFTTELLRDSALATRNHLYRWRRASTAALSAALLAGAAVWAAVSVERRATAELEHMQATWDAATAALSPPPRRAAPSAPLLGFRQQLLAWRPEDPGFSWGLDHGEQLWAATAAAYTRAVCEGVLRPLAARSETSLREFVDRFTDNAHPSRGEQDRFLDQLHFYTLLSGPDFSHDPWGTEDESAWLVRELRRRWSDDDAAGSEGARDAILQTHRELAPTAAPAPVDPCRATGGALALPFDEALALAASDVLTRAPPENGVVEGIVLGINNTHKGRSVVLERDRIEARTTLLPAYTRRGWEEAREQIQRQVEGQSGSLWFLRGEHVRDDRHTYCLKLRDNYVDRYLGAWEEAIQGVRIKRSADLTELRTTLETLTRQKKLAEIWQEIALHSQDLPPILCPKPEEGHLMLALRTLSGTPEPRAAAGAVGQRDARTVHERFAPFVAYGVAASNSSKRPAGPAGAADPLALDDYHDRLSTLLKELVKASAAATDASAAKNALHEEARRQRQDILDRIAKGGFGDWQGSIETTLRPPLDDLVDLIGEGAGKDINRAWCQEVIGPLRQRAVRYYPFVRDQRQQTSLEDLSDLLHPDTGLIAKFRDTHLSGYLDVGGPDVKARSQVSDAERHIHPSVVALLDDARKLGILLLSSGAPSLDFRFKSTCKPTIYQLVLSLGGEEQPYQCGPREERTLHWPPGKPTPDPNAPTERPGAATKPAGATLIARGQTSAEDKLSGHGVFGFFWMIEDNGTVRRVEGRHAAEVTFNFGRFGAHTLTFTPTPVQGGTLFYGFGESPSFLAPFRTPALLSPPEQLFTEIPYACPP